VSIELERVSKRHGAAVVLDDISLAIGSGELVALIGPSGSGKTTALRVVAGLERDYAGTVRIGGRDVSEMPARTRRIGFVFQNYALFRHMTVAANVAFGLRVRPRATRPNAAAIGARVAELLNLVQMGELGVRYPDQLSGGQRQRVALARALAVEPAVLLLDEPFGALDPPVRHELRRTLRALHDRLGLTTVLVTHDREEAFEVADRVAVLAGGRVQQIGTPEALDASPANPFVFAFLGESVRIEGHVAGGLFHTDTLGVPPLPTGLADGRGVALIRPSEIRLTLGEGRFRIVTVQRMVGSTRCSVAVGNTEIPVVVPGPFVHIAPGAACDISLAAARVIA